jgi:hypothetical protein
MSAGFADTAEGLFDNGYTPLPVIDGQKRPSIKDWSGVNYSTSPHLLDELRSRYPRGSTGILLGDVCVIDIDVLDEEAADHCRHIVTSAHGEAPCRFGKAPKSALFFRVQGPGFKKLVTRSHLINGQKAQVEILCDGQQVVVFGTHPDTKKPYYWADKDLRDIAISELPAITESEAAKLLEKLEAELNSRALPPACDHSEKSESQASERRAGSPKSLEGRNGFLFSKGFILRKEGADDDEVRSALKELNRVSTVTDHPNFAQGPLPENELGQIVSSVLKFEAPDLHQLEQDSIKQLNSKHSVVMVGGKCVVANEEIDPSFGYENITFSSQADLVARYANRFIGRGKNKTTEGRAWLAHPDRRQYDGIVFAPGRDVPGYLNLDKGFAVVPRHGDCSLFLDHVRNNICRCDEDLSNYLLAWMADCVQNRSERPGVAVVLRGRQGTGKGILCSQFGALFGPHFAQVTQVGHLTGNFNSHLKDKLLVHADEAFWAGDKKAEGVLKALITEDTIQIEMKGKDVITFRNHIRLIVSSNNDWIVPAGNEERRFFMLDVSEARMQDRAYFGSIIAQMDNGGREALLQYLLDYDLSVTDVGSPPKTAALMDQKRHSSSPLESWWYERLSEGQITAEKKTWKIELSTTLLYEDYVVFSQNLGVKRRLPQSAFGKQLKALVPDLERCRVTRGKSREWVYRLSTLKDCRRHFDRLTMGGNDWPCDDE